MIFERKQFVNQLIEHRGNNMLGFIVRMRILRIYAPTINAIKSVLFLYMSDFFCNFAR